MSATPLVAIVAVRLVMTSEVLQCQSARMCLRVQIAESVSMFGHGLELASAVDPVHPASSRSHALHLAFASYFKQLYTADSTMRSVATRTAASFFSRPFAELRIVRLQRQSPPARTVQAPDKRHDPRGAWMTSAVDRVRSTSTAMLAWTPSCHHTRARIHALSR